MRNDDGPRKSMEVLRKLLHATPEEMAEMKRIADEREKQDALKAKEESVRLAEEAKRAEQERIRKELARFPKRYADASFDNYLLYSDEPSRVAQQHTIDCLRSGNSLVMYGKNGTGKTRLAYSFLRDRILAGKKCKYILAPALFDEIRNTYAKESYDTSVALVDRYARYDHLVIDELDKTFGTKAEFIGLYRIINARYDDLKPTVIMTNADDATVIDIVGRSCYERLIEYPGTAVKMEWKSFRARGEK